jgi:xanthosine utilization system XapX-like protein
MEVASTEGVVVASLAGQAQPLTMVGRLVNGIVGGLAGGLLFGILMQAIGMIPMVAMLVGSKSVVVGWLVHLAISSFIGASFAVLFGSRATQILPAALFGLGYGVVWWVLGGLLIMPARLGMGVFTFNTMAWLSLLGHLVYGLAVGIVFALLSRRGRGEPG